MNDRRESRAFCRNIPAFWWHIHLPPPLSGARSSPPAASPPFCMCSPLSPACAQQQGESRRRIIVNGSDRHKPECTASQMQAEKNGGKKPGCDGHLLPKTRPSILILSNVPPTEGTQRDHLPQDGKTQTSITTSKHIIPPHWCFTHRKTVTQVLGFELHLKMSFHPAKFFIGCEFVWNRSENLTSWWLWSRY